MPDLDGELEGAGDEEVGDEGVPLYGVDRSLVGWEGVEVLTGVLRGGSHHSTYHGQHQTSLGIL